MEIGQRMKFLPLGYVRTCKLLLTVVILHDDQFDTILSLSL
jgi:hypothetical protein